MSHAICNSLGAMESFRFRIIHCAVRMYAICVIFTDVTGLDYIKD